MCARNFDMLNANSLPSLTSLALDEPRIYDVSSLLDACPSLEELALSHMPMCQDSMRLPSSTLRVHCASPLCSAPPVDVLCAVCGATIYRDLRAYLLDRSAYRMGEFSLYTNTPPLEDSTCTPDFRDSEIVQWCAMVFEGRDRDGIRGECSPAP